MMANLNFKKWFEEIDSADIANFWQSLRPSPKINPTGIKSFSKRFTNIDVTSHFLNLIRQGRQVVQIVYQKPISGNLVEIKDERLRDATGLYDSRQPPDFSFFMEGEEAGRLLIRIPPVIIQNEDAIFLEGIISHESAHAADWIDPNIKEEYPTGNRFDMDMSLYAKNLYEARGNLVQIEVMIKKAGGVREALEIINNPNRVLRMKKGLREIAIKYLEGRSINESIGSLVAPFVTGASLMMSPPTYNDKNVEKPAMTSNYNQSMEIVTTLDRTLNLLLFRNFIQI